MALDSTPRANRLHLGIFGKVNTGKSTFLNTMTDQKAAIVSNIAGTTTDPIYKAMELAGIRPVVWIDTAGTKDETTLSAERQKKTLEAAKKTDLAFVLFEEADITEGLAWIEYFRKKKDAGPADHQSAHGKRSTRQDPAAHFGRKDQRTDPCARCRESCDPPLDPQKDLGTHAGKL